MLGAIEAKENELRLARRKSMRKELIGRFLFSLPIALFLSCIGAMAVIEGNVANIFDQAKTYDGTLFTRVAFSAEPWLFSTLVAIYSLAAIPFWFIAADVSWPFHRTPNHLSKPEFARRIEEELAALHDRHQSNPTIGAYGMRVPPVVVYFLIFAWVAFIIYAGFLQ